MPSLLGPVVTAEPTFPGAEWERVTPAQAGLEGRKLKEFIERMGGGAGCIVREGRMIMTWGDVTSKRDWASATKPVLSTLLLSAINTGRIPHVDTPVTSLGWPLKGKDAGITFRHLANMTSGYARVEEPGAAWAYNDTAIQLYAKSLERVYRQPLDVAIREQLAPLQFQDGVLFGSRGGLGMDGSVRDVARIALLWLNEGRWRGQKLIGHRLFTRNVRNQVPASLPASTESSPDYLKIGSYGGGTSQTQYGPGVYGFNFWFNGKLPNGRRVWPDAPTDTFQANGHWNHTTITLFPSQKMIVLVRAAPQPGKFSPGDTDGAFNTSLKLLMSAVRKPAKLPTGK